MVIQTATRPLTPKQERFCFNLFSGMSQREAFVEAGYSRNQLPATLDRHAFDLAHDGKIQARIADLHKRAEDATVATVLERKQMLTEIMRGRFADFMGGELTKDKLRSAALQEVSVTTSKAGAKRTTIKLHDPIRASDQLNKLDGLYSETNQINIQNNVNHLEAHIVHFDSAEVARAVREAMRLGLNPAVLGGNGHGEDATLLPASTDIQAAPLSQS